MIAPPDGSPLWIGYQDLTITSPDAKNATEWKYEWQPPHGDGLFSVRYRGRLMPDLFWGRGHAWSPGSDYFTLEQYTAQKKWLLHVVRVIDGRWFTVAEDASVEQFIYPRISYFIGGKEENIKSQFEFTGTERWEQPR